MGSTGTPTLLGAAIGPLGAMGDQNTLIVPFSFTMSSSYATGGDTFTETTEAKGVELAQVYIANPIPAVGTDQIFSWNGSASAPKITANVLSTAAEVTATTDLSGTTLYGFAIYSRG